MGFDGAIPEFKAPDHIFTVGCEWVSPTVVDKGISTCSNFGGEGTGIKCEAPSIQKVNVAYRFELQTAVVVAGESKTTPCTLPICRPM